MFDELNECNIKFRGIIKILVAILGENLGLSSFMTLVQACFHGRVQGSSWGMHAHRRTAGLNETTPILTLKVSGLQTLINQKAETF